MKTMFVILIAGILSTSCNKDECRKCYYVTYSNGKEVSRDFDKKTCLTEGQAWNGSFQPGGSFNPNGVNYECPK